MQDNDVLNEALVSLESWLHLAYEHASVLSTALLSGAHATTATRLHVGQPPREEGAAGLLRAFGEIAAAHAALQRALEGAEERLDQLPVRLDRSAIKPL